MNKAILILGLMLMLGACAVEPPREHTVASNLCTADDPNCGPPGSNPVQVANSMSHGWVASNFSGASLVHVDCFATGGASPGVQCHVTFSWGGWSYTYGCALWDGGDELDCSEE